MRDTGKRRVYTKQRDTDSLFVVSLFAADGDAPR